MMNRKLKTEEIEKLLPDYVSGKLGENDRRMVGDALETSPELRKLCSELKTTFSFIDKTEFEAPPPEYWNSLLPRIHERIEQRKQSIWWLLASLSAGERSGIRWRKVLLPAAAVVLIFIIYETLISPGPEITREQKDSKETIIKDSVRNAPPQLETIDKVVTKEEKVVPDKRRRMVKKQEKFEIVPPVESDVHRDVTEVENGKDEEAVSNEMTYNITSPVDEVEEIYLESENEFNKLSSFEQEQVLNKLEEIDL